MNSKIQRLNIDYQLLVPLLLICGAIIALIPPMGVDFTLLYPAGRAVLALENPYAAAPLFFNPPWLLAILAPLSLLPIQPARWLWMLCGMAGYFIAFRRLKLDRFSIVALFLCPFVYFDLGIGNLDWLVLLGATLPAAWGAWFVILKPQTSIILLGLWLKQRQWYAALPALLLGALFLVGWYALPVRSDMPWSADIFPYGIPMGLLLAYLAIKRDDSLLALAAMPFLSPYLALQSWLFVLLPLTRNRWTLAAGVVIGWIFSVWFTGYAT